MSGSVIDLLRRAAEARPEQVAYTFLLNDGLEEVSITYEELDHQARKIAAYLQSQNLCGNRVLLLYPAGLEYIAAFFGCLYAGAVAVPAYPPKLNRSLTRLQTIAADAGAKLVLTTRSILSRIEGLFPQLPELQQLKWLMTDSLANDPADSWHMPAVDGNTLAFLQYTSGSTAEPKGVMVSHGNILHNESMIQRLFEQTENSVIVGWLPFYHDMGLIGNVLQPLYLGARCILMAPMTFLQQPSLWLEAITRYRATTSGGPDFAYNLCIRKITDKQKAALDLSTWTVAYNGAEPVRRETIENFTAAFASCGFRREAFQPCYGLAESTLLVSGGKRKSMPVLKAIETAALERHRVIDSDAGNDGTRFIVSCGYGLPEQKLAIVEPETMTECLPGEIGEIWLSSPSVAGGYWNRPEQTAETFGAYLTGTKEGPYLRTGDLGFVHDGEIFVTGRRKDLIIVRGLNYYPQDIELTVEQSHEALRPGCSAAFAVNRNGDEKLVIVQELNQRRQVDVEVVFDAIRMAVSGEHELNPGEIVLAKAGSVPRTSSGKIRRSACREMLLAGEIEVVAAWREPELDEVSAEPLPAPARDSSVEAIEGWLISLLASKLKIDAARIEKDKSLACYGLDSLIAIDLAHQVESAFDVHLAMVSFLQGLTVSELAARVLVKEVDASSRSITSAENVAESPLSFGQKSIWFMQRFAPNSAAYNIGRAVRFHAELDVDALRAAFQTLIARHDSLRTSFHATEGEPFQTIHEHVTAAFEEMDASTWSEDFLQGSLAEVAHQAFDLERAPLLRVRCLKRAPDDYVLLLVVHHIIADLWSLVVLLDEVFAIYEAERTRTQSSLPLPPLQYAGYVGWQAEMVGSAEGERHWTYWQTQLAGDLPLLNLSTKTRPAVRSYKGGLHHFKISAELLAQLKSLGRERGATLFMTLLAAFNTLLYRYTDQEDQLVGTTTAGRSHPQLIPLIGYFVNPLALRTKLSADLTFANLLERVQHSVLEAFEHQDYPFSLLVERLQPERTADRSPIFDVMFVLQKSHLPDDAGLASFAMDQAGATRRVGDFELQPVPIERRTAQFDLSLIVAEGDAGLLASFEYDAELFNAETVKRLAHHYRNVLEAVVANPQLRVSEVPLLSAVETQQLLVEWNRTEREFPRTHCTQDAFVQQVERTPLSIAVAAGDRRLSYSELNIEANRLASYLRTLGVGPETLVAIFAEPAPELIVGMVAVLQAGAAYVPLDPNYPDERLSYMLDHSGAAVLLTQRRLVNRVAARSTQVICLDADRDRWMHARDQEPSSFTHSDNLAYVIYTSGSTGRPKGVCCHHAGVINLLADFQRRAPLGPGDNCSLWTSVSFDVSVYEVFSALLAGATLHIVPDELRSDFDKLGEWLSENRITSAYLPPAMLPEFAESLKRDSRPYHLRRLLVGVEPINETVLAAINQHLPELRIINGYGPTEATICATLYDVQTLRGENRNTPIGRPPQNMQTYLLDSHFSPVPVGVSGELYLGGVGLSRGYLKRPDLTAERFVPNPFSSRPGERLYRTGDLARYDEEGQLEYFGRMDQQVKLRGYRIELGEIEAVLSEHHRVQDCVVVAIGERGKQQLAAYVVARANGDGNGSLGPELRRHLQQRLPHYMVPAWIEQLEALPLTTNGKLDRRALPTPGEKSAQREERPLTPVEEVVAGAWCEVLGVSRVGADDDFFALGGHSLLATRVVSKIRDIFNVELSLPILFNNPTVAGVADAIEQARQHSAPPPRARIARASRDSFRVGETNTGTLVVSDVVRQRL